MAMRIFQISVYCMILSSVVLAIYSVLYCWRSYNPRYLRSFPIYTLVNASENLVSLFLLSLRPLLENVFTLFEMIYFAYFLIQVTTKKKTKKMLWLFMLLFSGLYLWRVIRKDVMLFTGFMVLIESFMLCIGSIVYFRELMLEPLLIDLAKNPAFWMVIGILFYFVMLIPAVFFSGYLQFKSDNDLGQAIYSINNYAQVINSILFIKAMTCLKKR